jgi:ATP/maltotriose-dependent transcriptional regulator MalT/DNA-binding SARP family transcriptional activator
MTGSQATSEADGPGIVLLRRRRLEAILDGVLKRRLTVITGGAGTGKTTLLGQWIGRRASAWHSITPGDDSLAVLARGVLNTIRLQVPDLSPDLFLAIDGAPGPDSGPGEAERADALAAELCRDLEGRLEKDLVMVLDDLHDLNPNGQSMRFVSALCRNAADRLHLILTSRDSLPFPTSRLQVRGDAAEVGAEALAFSEAEVAELLELNDRPAESARSIMAGTGGWPVAVALAIRSPSFRRGPDPDGWDHAELFGYLAEEVVGTESGPVVKALRVGAVLPWITPGLAEALDVSKGAQQLFSSVRATVYGTHAPGQPGAVTFSPLVREFLLDRFPLDTDESRDLLRQAAEWYEANGSIGEAVTCLTRSGDIDGVVSLLGDRGEVLLASGYTAQLIEAIESVPPGDRDDRIRLLEAEARQMLGDWEGATQCYGLLVPDSGEIPSDVAWRLGFLHHMRGDVTRALDVYQRGALDQGDPANGAALLAYTASAFWLRGQRDEAQDFANRSLDLARVADDSRSLATAHTVLAMVAALDGDRAANDMHYLRALEHAERARDVIQTIRIRSNRGSHFLEEGDYTNAMAELEIALRLSDMTGFELWRAISLSNRAHVNHARGRLEEAVADLGQARAVFRRMGSTLESYPLAQLGDIYALRGDTALARNAYEEAMRLAEEPADLQALVPALSGLARIIAEEEPERARELADRAASVATVIGHVRALLARGFVALSAQDQETAAEIGREAGHVGSVRRDLPGMAEALELEAAATGDTARKLVLLGQARGIWTEIESPVGVARVDLASAALADDGSGADMAETAAASLQRLGAKGLALEARQMVRRLNELNTKTVSIRAFGAMRIEIDGVSVPVSAWQSRVAREILGMLIAARGRAVHREVVIERLWPDDDVSRAANRLSVALTTIRNVLDPERAEESDHYLIADRDNLALSLDDLDLDLERFYVDAHRGRAFLREGARDLGLAALSSAESRYLGALLEEFPYADWATAPREEARAEFMSIAGMLASEETADGNHDAAARWYLRILEQDAYNEPAHLELVMAMTAAGRHGTARRLYGNYVTRMAELEVEPAAFPIGNVGAGRTH